MNKSAIFHEFKQGHLAFKNICANYGRRSIIKKRCYNWFVKLCSGNTHLKDKKRLSIVDKRALHRFNETNPVHKLWALKSDIYWQLN